MTKYLKVMPGVILHVQGVGLRSVGKKKIRREIMVNEEKQSFTKYYKTILDNCMTGFLFLKILGHQKKFFEENPEERNLLPLFFNINYYAHFYSFLSHLFLIIDKNTRGATIFQFIKYIEDNLDEFPPKNKNLIKEEIDKDKIYLHSKKQTIIKLRKIRNQAHFHQDIEFADDFNKHVYIKLKDIPIQELEKLIRKIYKMVKQYKSLFLEKETKKSELNEIEKYIKGDMDDLFKFIIRGKRRNKNS